MTTGGYVEDLTALLNAATRGEPGAGDRAWSAIYAEIREMAARACSAYGTRAQLKPTMRVHEL